MRNIKRGFQKNASLIFTCIGVGGVIATAGVGVWVGMKTAEIKAELGMLPEDKKERFKLYAKAMWKYYVVLSLSAILSAGSVIASHKISAKDIARLATLATGSGAAFRKYRGKVKEILGEEKEKEIYEQVKVKEDWGINYPRIVDRDDEYYNDLYVKYRLDFGIPEIPAVEFDSNPERVTSAFYCVNRDFALGRIIDVILVKDYLGIPYDEKVDSKYFWIDTMFYESGMQPWIEFDEVFKDGEDEEGRTIHTITVETPPVDNKTLEKIEDGSYWDDWRA